MQATQILMDEHRVIERMLDAVERAAELLVRGTVVRPGVFLEAADFFAGYADGCHHRKEEGVLFGAMRDAGMAPGEGAIETMLSDHEDGRRFTRNIRAAARRLETGDANAAAELAAHVRGYVALLRDHIAREDEMLFPMADDLIPVDRHRTLLEAYARIDRDDVGVAARERFLETVARIEGEVASLAR